MLAAISELAGPTAAAPVRTPTVEPQTQDPAEHAAPTAPPPIFRVPPRPPASVAI